MLRLQARDREILRLAVPAFGALVAEPLYVLADTAIVGRIGTKELAGLAVATGILLTGYSIFIFLAYGTTAAVSRLIGAGEHRAAAHQAVQGVWLATTIGVVLALVTWPASPALVGLFSDDDAVRANAIVYLRISLFGLPAMLLTLAGVGYLRGRYDTRRPLLVAGVTALVNLVVEAVLIFGYGFGIGASALATVIAQWLGAAAYLWWIATGVREHDVGLRPDHATMARLARVGGHLFVRTAALRGAFVGATAVAGRKGDTALAAHQIAFNLWMLTALILDAVAIAGQAIVGRVLGQGDAAEARAASDRMLVMSTAVAIVLGVALLATSPFVTNVFSDDADVVRVSSFLLLWVAALQPLSGVVFALDGVLIGAGDQRYLAWAMAVAALAYVPLAWAVAVVDAGIGWLWASLVAFMAFRAIGMWHRYRTNRWAVTGAVRA